MYLGLEVFGKGVHTGNAHAVQTAGDFVGIFIELPAGVQNGHNHFQGRLFQFFVHIRRDTTPIVPNGDRIVLVDDCLDLGTITSQVFVDGVVHHFPYEMVQTFCICTSDVHSRAFPHGLQAFQRLNITGAILARLGFQFFLVFYCFHPAKILKKWCLLKGLTVLKHPLQPLGLSILFTGIGDSWIGGFGNSVGL